MGGEPWAWTGTCRLTGSSSMPAQPEYCGVVESSGVHESPESEVREMVHEPLAGEPEEKFFAHSARPSLAKSGDSVISVSVGKLNGPSASSACQLTPPSVLRKSARLKAVTAWPYCRDGCGSPQATANSVLSRSKVGRDDDVLYGQIRSVIDS